MRENKGGTSGIGRTDFPTVNETNTIMESSSDTGSDPDLGGREEIRRAKKESKRR